VAAKGLVRTKPLLERLKADDTLRPLARELFIIHAKEYAQLQTRLEEVEDRLMAWHRANECSQPLAKIPGVGGAIGAPRLVIFTRWRK
jgi:transposase